MFLLYYNFDPTILILIPAMILAGYAQFKIMGTYSKYSNLQSKIGMTGKQIAEEILKKQGIYDVSVEMVNGKLTDHFDPIKKVVRLSNDNFCSSSISAISVAAHEVGHAIQHSKGYAPLNFRSALVPIVNFSSNISWLLISIGLLLSFSGNTIILKIGILLFSVVLLFQIVTLPVEFNASKRAIKLLNEYGFLQKNEISHSKEVLKAAALTYVAAVATSLTQILRLLIITKNREN